jgi:hypothetical protein
VEVPHPPLQKLEADALRSVAPAGSPERCLDKLPEAATVDFLVELPRRCRQSGPRSGGHERAEPVGNRRALKERELSGIEGCRDRADLLFIAPPAAISAATRECPGDADQKGSS